MGSEPKEQSRSPFTTISVNYRSLNSPMNSAEETKLKTFFGAPCEPPRRTWSSTRLPRGGTGIAPTSRGCDISNDSRLLGALHALPLPGGRTIEATAATRSEGSIGFARCP
jgi:hypothetical protein